MKRILTILLTLLMFSAVAPKVKAREFRSSDILNPKIASQYRASVSLVTGKGTTIGSGTIIYGKKNGYIIVITAEHVVEGFQERGEKIFAAVTYSSKLRELKVLKVDKKADLALLIGTKKEKKSVPYIKISSTYPRIGDRIMIIGSPAGARRTVTTGIVSNYKFLTKKEKGVLLYRITAPLYYGNSGGGLFNSQGELVGVVCCMSVKFGIVPVPGAGYAVSLSNVRRFL